MYATIFFFSSISKGCRKRDYELSKWHKNKTKQKVKSKFKCNSKSIGAKVIEGENITFFNTYTVLWRSRV